MLAVIGGTGIYALEGVEVTNKTTYKTPFGTPSAPIETLRYCDCTFLFIPRHGNNHQLLPHEVNYAANIFALKSAGATQVLSFSAVGSLREAIAPGDFVLPDQYFDYIKGQRRRTFFGNGLVAHVSTAQPTCVSLAQWVKQHLPDDPANLHMNVTYACVDGPRLGTKAESYFLRNVGCDVLGMTNVPEVFLAREAQLCYTTLGIVTDYDCWMDDPSKHVSVAEVIQQYGESIKHAKALLQILLDAPLAKEDACRHALATAVLTPENALSNENRDLLAVLRK